MAIEDENPALVVFQALANGDRLVILDVLGQGSGDGMNITQVARATELSRFSAARHLELLSAAGMVAPEHRGRSLIYRLRSTGFDHIDEWLYRVAPE